MDFSAIAANLEHRGFHNVSCFASAEVAADYLNRKIDGKTVGFGGSVTLQDMGLYESLGTHNRVFWHWRVPEGETPDSLRRAAAGAQIYLTSVNGLAETGELINIDGAGNRVAATLYGHEKVYFIVGRNKIAPDYDAALYRARNVAGPRNAARLNKKTPCALRADRCYDCGSPERICRGLVVLWGPMMGMDCEIVLIDEDLGY